MKNKNNCKKFYYVDNNQNIFRKNYKKLDLTIIKAVLEEIWELQRCFILTLKNKFKNLFCPIKNVIKVVEFNIYKPKTKNYIE